MSDEHVAGAAPERDEPARAPEAQRVTRPESGLDTAGAVLGAVTPEEHNEILAAAGDPVVSEELADMEHVASELARLAPAATINRGRSAGIRSRLISRATASKDARPHARSSATTANAVHSTTQATRARRSAEHSAPVKPASASAAAAAAAAANAQSRASRSRVADSVTRPSHSSGNLGTWLMAAVAIVAVAVGGTYGWRAMHSDTTQIATTRTDTVGQKLDSMSAALAARDSVIASLTGPGTRVIEMVSSTASTPMGRVFWNQRTNHWSMYAYHMPMPQPGRTYQLWMIARGHATPIPAGTFQPDSSGVAVMSETYALDPASLRALAVTDEPAGGSPTPTGERVIAGNAR